jgi:SWI/SNF-related matrix-associated actin-dependent regulator of chromatin subfamily A member 5
MCGLLASNSRSWRNVVQVSWAGFTITNDTISLITLCFRCRTCPVAFCEDCLPEEGWRDIGDTLPELENLGFGFRSTRYGCQVYQHSDELNLTQSYYIQCPDCVDHFGDDQDKFQEWLGE